MKVDPVSEKILIPSQNWTPDGGRNSLNDYSLGDQSEEEKVKSSAAKARPTSGSGADGLGADGETGRECRGG